MCQVDLNCDMGESYGRYTLGNDEEMMKYITSANIACGFHAGDPKTMDETVQRALQHQVSIGAHPGFPDLNGFGRRLMQITSEEAYQIVLYQIGALQGFVQANGGQLHHVKPHGAFYNLAAANASIAEAIAEAIYKLNPELILYGLANSQLTLAGEKLGLRVAHEVFADRTYQKDGTLTPRNQEHALIHDPELAIQQVLTMIKEKRVHTVAGEEIPIQADTICIHGDGAQALQFVINIFNILKSEDIQIRTV